MTQPRRAFAAMMAATLLGLLPAAASAATLSAAGEGRRLWLKLNCYGCHGMDGSGGMGPRLRGDGAEAEDVNEVVRQGSDEGMPGFSRLVSPTDITNLTAYLNSLGKSTEPTFTHWWEATPSR